MITLLLMGGLGNQMFQYAFARSLALSNGSGLRLSRRFLRNDTYGRIYSLNKLSLPDDVQLMTRSQELGAHARLYVTRKLHLSRSFHTHNYIYFNARDFDRYEDFRTGPDTIINGYFQNWKYLREYDAIIRQELRVSASPSPENQAMIHELSSSQSVCVHARRGDYLALRYGQVCNHEYYLKAMQYVSERVSSPVFYFFSNTHEDIQWLRENYGFSGFSVRYIDLGNPDYEELRLMYTCRHFIIANSTLSWWGSWLSDSPSKIICAPSKWLDEREIESTGLYHSGLRVIR